MWYGMWGSARALLVRARREFPKGWPEFARAEIDARRLVSDAEGPHVGADAARTVSAAPPLTEERAELGARPERASLSIVDAPRGRPSASNELPIADISKFGKCSPR